MRRRRGPLPGDGEPKREIAAGYLHLSFPMLSPKLAFDLIERELNKQGWTSEDADQNLIEQYYGSWKHTSAPARLSMATIGLTPFAVTIGRDDEQTGGDSLVRQTLRRLLRHASEAGGRPILDAALRQYHQDAENWRQRQQAAREQLQAFEYALECRRCPRCKGLCAAIAQECRFCEYWFTGGDDRARDDGHVKIRRRVVELRAVLAEGAADPAMPADRPGSV